MTYPIRRGTNRDWRAMRMLLPGAFGFEARPGAVVATSEDGRLVVGVAAISPRLRSEPVVGPRVDVHVVEPYRRRGIGRRLLAAAAETARRGGAAALYAWQPQPANGPEAATWRRMGFDRAVAVQQGRASVKGSYDYLLPIYQRIVSASWIPPNARLVRLQPEHAEPIAKLHVQHLGGQHAEVLASVRGESPVRYHPALSPVLLIDGRVMGFTLVQIHQPGIALVEGMVVDPSLRRGWANLWLKFAGAYACREENVHTVVYYTYDRHADTRNVARHAGESVIEMAEPYMLLETPPGGAAPMPGGPGDRTAEPR